MRPIALLAAAAALSCTGMALGQASFTPSGYTENFDSMGTTGTTPPTGWKHFAGTFGTNSTWVASIPTSGSNSVATMAVGTAGTTLTATTTPAANNNNGFNAARAAAATSDRVLATAPTTFAGNFLQLQLTNDSGASLPAGSPITVAFDIVRYTAPGTANELPGYWLFVSADAGVTWSNVTPNPTITTVPNTVGITNCSLTATLPAAWNSGASLYFRWVDDNAVQTSPDQIIGLNNVTITAAAPVNGRCCFTDGSCTETDSVSCTGVFTAAGVCTPNTCPLPPSGSCCQSDGSCTVTLQAACTATWTNAGTCTPNTCPILVASLIATGYTENFDALGPTGTALPIGFSMWTVAGDRPTFEEVANGGLGFITPSAVSTATIVTGVLAVYDQSGTATPATRNAGYNFGFSAAPANRLLGVSPTGNGASFMQLRLRNDTGAPVTNLTVQYTFRIMSPWTANELAGYEFFYSTSGPTGTYTAIPALDGVATSTDLTGDSIAKSGVINLASPLAPGAELLIRWGDDNGNASPDQAYAIDNVSILGVDPSTLGACCAGDGSCSLVLDDDVCIGGIFRGIGTTCANANCPQPPSGSCCAIDGTCSITIQANCPTLWTLDGNCIPNICPGPLSACCAADGSCSLLSPAQCAGGFVVAGTCTPFLCRQPGVTRCIAFGDYGIDGGNQPAVASRMKTFNPEFLLTTGDNTYFTSTSITNYDNTQAKYYREFIKITNPASAYFGQGSPVNNFYPLMGNHDMDIGGGASASIPYWNAYWELPGNERYYTFSRGPIDFFMLSSDGREPDSNSATGAQHAWFAAAYAASTAPFKIVAFHHPAQTSVSGHGPDNTMRSWNFQDLPGITAVLAGHNHNLERLEFGGIPWFVTGAGGNSLYSISSVDPNSVFRNDTQWGFLLIDADASSITCRFVNAAGQIIDTRSVIASGACCRGSSCTVGLATACTGPSTRFAGANSVCNALANNTSPCCRADFNQSGTANVTDIFDFLTAWFTANPAADFDQSGTDTVTDIFDFLSAWFVGC